MENVHCPLCGSEKETFLWEKEGARYVRCQVCTLIYENPRLDAEELKEFYSHESYFLGEGGGDATSGYTDYFAQCSNVLVHEYFRVLVTATGLKAGARFLDVGCGPGGLVQHAQGKGWISSGVELSSWAASYGKQQGLDIFEGTLQDARHPDNTFDVISLFDVIEHLPEPHAVMREIHRILKPGGWVVAQTPNIEGFFARHLYRENSEMVKPRAHIMLFGPATSRRLFESARFRDVRVTTFPYCRKFTPGYFKSLIVTRLRRDPSPRQLTWNEALMIVARK